MAYLIVRFIYFLILIWNVQELHLQRNVEGGALISLVQIAKFIFTLKHLELEIFYFFKNINETL